jgi:hypothetical protein
MTTEKQTATDNKLLKRALRAERKLEIINKSRRKRLIQKKFKRQQSWIIDTVIQVANEIEMRQIYAGKK